MPQALKSPDSRARGCAWRVSRAGSATGDTPDKRVELSGNQMRELHLDNLAMTALSGASAAVMARGEVIEQAVASSRDVAFINAVVNDPSVRPFVGPMELGKLDLSEAIARPENLCMMGLHGGFILAWSAPGVREVHTFILPDGRGDWAKQARAEVIAYCADQGDTMLWTKIPPDQPHVARFAVEGGMKPTGQTVETFGVAYMVYKMDLNQCL